MSSTVKMSIEILEKIDQLLSNDPAFSEKLIAACPRSLEDGNSSSDSPAPPADSEGGAADPVNDDSAADEGTTDKKKRPTVGVVFLPTFGGTELKRGDAVVWPPTAETLKEVLIGAIGTLIFKLVRDRNFNQLGNLMNAVKGGLVNLYEELKTTYKVDLSALDVIPADLTDVLNGPDVFPSGEVIRKILEYPPIGFKLDLYGMFVSSLAELGFKEGYNLFAFGYDFRRSSTYAARELEEFFERSRNLFEKNNVDKIILVGHGSGGLVARRFMETAKKCYAHEKVVLVITAGAPVNGCLDAAVCSAGLGRHLLTSPRTMRDLAKTWEGVSSLIPTNLEAYDRSTGVKMNVNDVPEFLGYDRATYVPPVEYARLKVPVINIAGEIEDTPYFITTDDKKTRFNRVVYGPGDGLCTVREVTRPSENNVVVKSGHMGLLFHVHETLRCIIGMDGRAVGDLNFLNLKKAIEELAHLGSEMKEELS